MGCTPYNGSVALKQDRTLVSMARSMYCTPCTAPRLSYCTPLDSVFPPCTEGFYRSLTPAFCCWLVLRYARSSWPWRFNKVLVFPVEARGVIYLRWDSAAIQSCSLESRPFYDEHRPDSNVLTFSMIKPARACQWPQSLRRYINSVHTACASYHSAVGCVINTAAVNVAIVCYLAHPLSHTR